MKHTIPASTRLRRHLACVALGASYTVLAGWPLIATAGAPTVSISQVPMTVALPAHPQIMLALGNSQSMDGTLSGAIMTGSGSLAAYPLLDNSSSPVNFNYTVGAGFTPPVNLGTVVCAPGPCAAVTGTTPAGTAATAPYTVNTGGHLVDNSPSRLNVAKAGIATILADYIDSADFGLMNFATGGLGAYTTWVYQMSPTGSGFQFTNNPPQGSEYVPNPCYQINILGANQVQRDCNTLNTYYGAQAITLQQYMLVGASSDDPAINDVLYAGGGIDPVCVVYGGPNPANPFPPHFSLANYENGGVTEGYTHQQNPCATVTGPTNAGYVPYSQEVMYEERGFGYYTTSEPTGVNTNPLVPMTSSGAVPTPTSVANAIAAFTPRLLPETNSTATTEIKAVATQSPLATLVESAAQYFIQRNPASTNGCNASRYTVLLTDGLPTMDLAGKSWPPLGSTAATGYGVTATFNGDGSLGATNDQALRDVITQLTNAQTAGIKTYIIGLGAGVSPASNPQAAATLTAMAIAGGTGNYFPAYSPQDLANDLDAIIVQILSATQATASAAVNSTGLNTSSVVYQSQFTTSDLYQDWTGNLLAYQVNATNGQVNTASPLWSAQTQLDAQTFMVGGANRLIATWDPVAGAAIPFEWTPGNPNTGIASSTALGQSLQTFAADANGSHVLQFVRGSNALEVRYGGQFRNRTHKLGDIVDSAPLYIGAPIASYQSPSYAAYATAQASRPPMIYVGADDGMLHAFDAATGNERFAYIPKGGFANLVKLVNPYYNAQHQFFVNGSPVGADVQFSDQSWHTIVVGTQAQGGPSVFALDVTNPSQITTEQALSSAVLWDFSDVDMGMTFSTPAITNTSYGWLVFVGNGYNSVNEKPVLYALNPQTGAIVKKIDLCAALTVNVCNMNASNGLSSVVAMNTSGQVTQAANVVYAGDLEGDLWRVDISNANPANWRVTVLFQATDSNHNPQPITTAPAVTLNPNFPRVTGTMVFVATGQLLGNPDLTTTQVQSAYGIFDPQTGFTPPLTRGNPVNQSTVSTTGMVVQTLSIPASNGSVVVDTSNPVSFPTNKGWYVDLTQETGQRVVTNPQLESGGALVFTTYQPNFNPVLCTENGASYLYVLNYATGGMFGSPQFDINSDGQINSSDTVQIPNPNNPLQQIWVPPVGLSLGNVYAAAPTIRTANFTTGAAVKLITLSSDQIKTVIEKGNQMSRKAWWEIRQ